MLRFEWERVTWPNPDAIMASILSSTGTVDITEIGPRLVSVKCTARRWKCWPSEINPANPCRTHGGGSDGLVVIMEQARKKRAPVTSPSAFAPCWIICAAAELLVAA